ncbi:hypothetical protein BJ546DRAFT_56676 [Cryomyces antarcticus]
MGQQERPRGSTGDRIVGRRPRPDCGLKVACLGLVLRKAIPEPATVGNDEPAFAQRLGLCQRRKDVSLYEGQGELRPDWRAGGLEDWTVGRLDDWRESRGGHREVVGRRLVFTLHVHPRAVINLHSPNTSDVCVSSSLERPPRRETWTNFRFQAMAMGSAKAWNHLRALSDLAIDDDVLPARMQHFDHALSVIHFIKLPSSRKRVLPRTRRILVLHHLRPEDRGFSQRR